MKACTNDVCVFVETTERGTAKRVGLELLTPGRSLSRQLGVVLTVVVLGSHARAAEEAAAYGARRILWVDSHGYRRYSTEAYTAALE